RRVRDRSHEAWSLHTRTKSFLRRLSSGWPIVSPTTFLLKQSSSFRAAKVVFNFFGRWDFELNDCRLTILSRKMTNDQTHCIHRCLLRRKYSVVDGSRHSGTVYHAQLRARCAKRLATGTAR